MEANLYLVPGLGNDRRVFQYLVPLLNASSINYLEHQDVHSRDLSIKAYAEEYLLPMIKHSHNIVLIGFSLGASIATELKKLVPKAQLIIISGMKKSSSGPHFFKVLRHIPAHYLVPNIFTELTVPFFARLLGMVDRPKAKLLSDMYMSMPKSHLSWGRNAIIRWESREEIPVLLHIHGTLDHIFPYKRAAASDIIKGGHHTMLLNRAEELAEIINKVI